MTGPVMIGFLRTAVANGVSPARILTFGAGASTPVATNATPEGRQQNRRVDIVYAGE